MVTKTFPFKSDMLGGVLLRRMEWVAPEELFASLADEPGFVWLDSGMPMGGLGRWSFMMWAPREAISGRMGAFWRSSPTGAKSIIDPFSELRKIMAQSSIPPLQGAPPFTGGAAGFFGYDLGGLLEPSLRPPRAASAPEGDIWIGVYGAVAAFDHLTGEVTLAAHPGGSESQDEALDRMEDAIRRGTARQPVCSAVRHGPLRSNFTRGQFMDAVQRVRRYIEQGDCYQANIAQRFQAEGDFGPGLYTRLRAINPAPFAAYINTGQSRIISASPERFISLRGGRATTMPIKGTRPRGRAPQEDNLLKLELQDSEKDRAENVMIVDLLRNDFSKVCRPHSVAAPVICAAQAHPTVFHLVSTVTGTLLPGLGALDLLEGAFPGGSVTGAPKIRAMEIIAEMEPAPRGAYCGAIGYLGFDGSMDTSVTIRTMIAADDGVSFHAGGGITYSSDPAEEYQETMDKARALIEAVS